MVILMINVVTSKRVRDPFRCGECKFANILFVFPNFHLFSSKTTADTVFQRLSNTKPWSSPKVEAPRESLEQFHTHKTKESQITHSFLYPWRSKSIPKNKEEDKYRNKHTSRKQNRKIPSLPPMKKLSFYCCFCG